MASRKEEPAEQAQEKKAPKDPLERSRLLALGAAVLVLFPVLAKSGIWDPYELDAADLARRIAVRVLGARALEMPNAVNALPTLTDLKMGELPFTSMALGFRLFGLHDWTGRLPLAVWGLVGAAVVFEFLARLVDRRAGIYGVVALVTMPLYFMQARTMLGDVVTMAALAMAFCGLAGAMLEDRGGARGMSTAQLGWLAVGAVGLGAGYLSRGAILGVAVPALAVGLAWLVLRGGAAEARPLGGRDSVGVVALAIGAVALVIGIRVLFKTAPEAPLSRVLGFALVKTPPVDTTFDLVVRQLGHALFPWSAFLPFAFGRLLRAPVEAEPEARDREIGVRVTLLVGAAVAYGAYAMIAPRTGTLAFSGVPILAAVAAIAILDFERGAPGSRALSVGTLLFGGVLLGDILREPEKALAAFVVDKPQFPKSFEADGGKKMVLVFALFAGVLALTWLEDQPRDWWRGGRAWASERADEYQDIAAEVARVWQGNLLFGAVVIEAALVGLGAMIFIGRRVGWQQVDRLPKYAADWGVNLWWIALVAVLAALPLYWLVRDAFRRLVEVSRLPRAGFAVVAALSAGAVQSFAYYPALAAQLSPKEAFESYARLAQHGEPLALLNVRSRAAAYYAGGEVESFSDVNRAFTWLTERPGQRRWVMLKAEDLPKLNSLYRGQAGKNLPILDGRSSQILLASNVLGDRPNESWLSQVVLDEAPSPANRLDAQFEDQLEVLGWEVADRKGHVVDSVIPATPYHLRTYYRTVKPITGTWKAFVHIDGQQRRFNGDHNVLDGKYAMNLWRPGDVVVDDLPFQLEPNFTPGDYTVYFGFFTGDTRFRVTRGPNQENRVIAGAIHVR
jgi:4-amino-4-deoxy-L-arabinose transferase-like glycosyltransferase